MALYFHLMRWPKQAAPAVIGVSALQCDIKNNE
jgi:hypothetical protein